MGNNNDEVICASQRNSHPKVHSLMCNELTVMLDEVSSILPSIEAAQPGCKAGIEELCNLYKLVDEGKLIIRHCIEYSSLYLAIASEATVMRCERIRDSLRQSLFLIQNMVPPLLANQIADVHNDLRDIEFIVDPPEEEAGKAILEILQQSDATEELELETFLLVASRLNLKTPKSILIERRAIKKLLDKNSGSDDTNKKGILKCLLYLVKKYEKNIRSETLVWNETLHAEHGSLTPRLNFASDAGTLGKCYTPTNSRTYDAHSNVSQAAMPPSEFCCPISMKLMCDPVTIASGQTYERECIERWFNEGYDSCPRTQTKIEDFSIIPNICMKVLICNWCKKHDFAVSEFDTPFKNGYTYSPQQLHSYSMSSSHNVSAPLIAEKTRVYVDDHSNTSFALSDASYVSDSFPVRNMEGPKNNSCQFSWNADYQRYLSFRNFNQDMFLNFFHELSKLPMDHQRKAIKDLKSVFNGESEVWRFMVSHGFIEAFLEFLKNDNGSCTVQAQKAGVQFFLAFLSDRRTPIPSMGEDAIHLIVSSLDSELKIEALLILHELLQQTTYRKSRCMATVVAPSVFGALDTEDTNCLKLCLKIISELSSDTDVQLYLISSGIISKLSTILNKEILTECCLKIIRNVSEVEEATELITRTDGCLSCIAEYLDTGNHKEQEHAVVILLTICSRSIDHCVIVMKEGVIPALVNLSVNGTEEGKACSMKLLQLLRDLGGGVQFSGSCSLEMVVNDAVPADPTVDIGSICRRPISKSSRFLSRKLNIFLKPRSVTIV